MARLPDGTSYAEQIVLNATAKQFVVTTTNSNYQKLGGKEPMWFLWQTGAF
jgi:hypothetical protein